MTHTLASITLVCLSEALSPITHMSRSEGNESLIALEPIPNAQGGVSWVPIISGNSMRHRCIRQPGAMHLVETLGLRGKLSLEQLNFLFHGGSLTQSTGRENTARIAEMYRLFPMLRLLGGCLPDQMLTGSLHVWRGVLLCEENRQTMTQLLPNGFELPQEPLCPAHAYMSGYQYTRSEAAKSAVDLASNDSKNSNSSLMIFSGQAIMRGAMFLHGFTLLHPSPLELGALLHSLSLWDRHGTVGGQSARGHGRLKMRILGDDDSRQAAVAQYVEHVEATKKEAAEWLNDAFTRPVVKPKGKKSTTETIDFFDEMTK